jgi:hypothetical protein
MNILNEFTVVENITIAFIFQIGSILFNIILSSGAQPELYGSGNGTIWLDNVRCTGNETSIVECNANPRGDNDCSHHEDVGVFCAEGNKLIIF